jgi:hypothetical protein
MLKPLKQHLIDVTSFRLSKLLYSQSILFKCTKNFGSVFPDHFSHRVYETKFPTHIIFLYFLFVVSLLTFHTTLKTFLLFMTVAILSHYQSPVNCRRRNMKGNFTHRGITVTIVNFQVWNLYNYLKE